MKLLSFYSRNLKTRLKHTWIQPQGFNTNIKVYNCIAKKKVPLIITNKDQVSWYTCGPTVYDSAHIGHASCYVKFDIIQRILKHYFKLNLVTVMNITDIDDKIINKSYELSVTPSELARKYENEFWIDVLDLNITKPDVIVRVTDHINTISHFIQKVIDNGSAYITPDGSVYFDLRKCKDNYGKLVPFVSENLENHIDESFKKYVNDFAIWKGTKPNEPSWKTNFGTGRPGWHSECSALASAVFGNQIDIHAGGMDLQFPHHENEEAISCAHHGKKQWVNYWLHAGHLNLAGHDSKMSKSLGNCIYIRDMLNSRKSASDIFRMACTISHYKSNMEYSNELMDTAEANLNKFISFINDCEAYVNRILPPAEINLTELTTKLSEAKIEIDLALKDDFNTSRVIIILSELTNATNKMLHRPKSVNLETVDLNDCAIITVLCNFIREQLNLLGFTSILTSNKLGLEEDRTASILNVLMAFRQNIRIYGLKNKNNELLKYCDSLRDELKMYGIEVQDRGKLSSWNKS